jgi:lipid-A-disaccharide synthase
MPLKILVSAGEASGDLYASELVKALARRWPTAEFFGCAGPRMQRAGVRPVIDAHKLAVVGLVEVVRHIPGIYREFRRLVDTARGERPDFAVLTDSPDFNLRLAKSLKKLGIPVIYLVAPQVWAWRKGRIKQIRRDVDCLLCIFPFEELFFRERGVPAHYIGHPLTRVIKQELSREQFLRKHGLDPARQLVTLLPGSRVGEARRHWDALAGAAAMLETERNASAVFAVPAGFLGRAGADFRERISGSSIQVVEGLTWDAIGAADVALAASGTVTVETALLGTPMVTFYRVTGLSWVLGRLLLDVPFYSMVNLIAGAAVVPELMQEQMTPRALASAAGKLLDDEGSRQVMRAKLAEVKRKLATDEDPMEKAASIVAAVTGF